MFAPYKWETQTKSEKFARPRRKSEKFKPKVRNSNIQVRTEIILFFVLVRNSRVKWNLGLNFVNCSIIKDRAVRKSLVFPLNKDIQASHTYKSLTEIRKSLIEVSKSLTEIYKSLIEFSKSLIEKFKSLIKRGYLSQNTGQISVRDFEISDRKTEISDRKTEISDWQWETEISDRITEISDRELDQASQARHTAIYSEMLDELPGKHIPVMRDFGRAPKLLIEIMGLKGFWARNRSRWCRLLRRVSRVPQDHSIQSSKVTE